jgi:inosine/xanthosine triphosphate pyrophosphatase family protein
MTLNYVTGNERKFSNAQSFFAFYDIEVKQLKLDIDEIQSEDALKITTAKA